MLFIIFLSLFVFFAPNILGHPDNYIAANPLVTPPHIVPEWYFLPFYAILRSIPNKLGGVVAMIGAIFILILLPFTNFSLIRSSKFRPIFTVFYWFLVSDFLLLGWIGQKPVEEPYIATGLFTTLLYFLIFLVLFPLTGFIEKKLQNKNLW
jgi:ubiquinol-cytochrome c reductase cytochrome b subunit